MEKIIQGKGYEFDWMTEQRSAFENVFKVFNAGDVANRPGSDISVYNILTRTTEEQQLKAYRSTAKLHLDNTPKNMPVVTNAEKVDQVKSLGYKDVISFKDRESIIADTDKRIREIESGHSNPLYSISNVGQVLKKAGILGFIIGIGTEAISSYDRLTEGKITKQEYIKELLLSGGDSGVTSALSAGIMIPITATLTVAGVTSLVTIPISFTLSTAINKVIAPAFARGDYKKILNQAHYYNTLTSLCSSISGQIMQSTEEYESFVATAYYQSKSFYSIRGKTMPSEYQKDFEYFQQLPRDQIGLVVASMVALTQNSDEIYDKLKNQNFIKRMVYTVLGKNKVSKEEIKKNSEKLSVYISQAISFLYERQAVDERIVQMLGQQILELGIENQEMKLKIQAVSDRVDLHQLVLEIDHGMFSGEPPIVAIYRVISRISPAQTLNYQEINVIKAALEKQGIISSTPIMEADILHLAESLPPDQMVVLYTALNQAHNSGLSRALFALVEAQLIGNNKTSETTETLQMKKSLEITPVPASTSFCDLFEQLLEDKKPHNFDLSGTSFSDHKNLNEAEQLFFAGKLIEAFSRFQAAAEANVPRAYYYLSQYYMNGYGEIVEDFDRAFELVKIGMNLGDPLCTYSYGIIKHNIDFESPERWMKQKLKLLNPLVRSNDPCALFEQGKYYINQFFLNEKGSVKEAFKKATSYLKRSAELGYWPAAYELNVLTLPDHEHPLNQLQKYSSLLLDVESYEIQFIYGRYYLFTDFENRKFFMQAAKCFLRALSLRESFTEPAGYVAFLLGTGLIEDSLRYGISAGNIPMYYKAGLKCDNPIALFEYMLLYLTGVTEKSYGVNLKKAAECAKRCYKLTKGNSAYTTMHRFVTVILGESYFEGWGVEKDNKIAVEYLSEAVQLGDHYSAKLLADYYSVGLKSIFYRSTIDELRRKSQGVKEIELSEETFLDIIEEPLQAAIKDYKTCL